MRFETKYDGTFLSIIGGTIIMILGVFLIPLFLEESLTAIEIIVSLSIVIGVIGSLLWLMFSTSYTLLDNHLLVISGPIRSKIPYEEITRIAPTSQIIVGYRILTSKDAIDISYKSGWMGSVKISPKQKERFVGELFKRCPNAKVEGFDLG
ncbi:PH domain-containing protein [Pseudalkalibacillus sp. Hm43]|uniref:PH domain-containing protein n=1 Tax=Pseudalkalibacillus sp. Hm43 TaxID=3450742 RepID=UPI003F430FA9